MPATAEAPRVQQKQQPLVMKEDRDIAILNSDNPGLLVAAKTWLTKVVKKAEQKAREAGQEPPSFLYCKYGDMGTRQVYIVYRGTDMNKREAARAMLFAENGSLPKGVNLISSC